MNQSNVPMVEESVALPRGFAHDGEHPQLEIPFGALIGSSILDGRSLSLTSAVVAGDLDQSYLGGTIPIALRVNFAGFAIVLYLDAWIEPTGNPEDMTYCLHFTDPTGEHLAPLRYLLNSYIAGDVVSLGGVMGYTGPLSVKEKATAEAPTLAFRLKNIARRTGIVALTAMLGLIALNIGHERLVFSYEARPVTITAPGQTLLSTAAGQMTYIDPEAKKGDVVYSIVSNSGDYLSVKMPCDCEIEPLRAFFEGATILPGMPLVRLSSGAEGLIANTEISAEGAVRLVAGDRIELVTSNGVVVPVAPELLPAPEDGSQTVPIELVLADIDGVRTGDVARLRFRRSILPSFLRSASAKAAIEGLEN